MTVDVHEGHVSLGRSVEAENVIPAIERLCRSVDGVVSVAGHITYWAEGSGVSTGE
ncbi:BON domain-containing protein [Streptomyces sp. NPDC057424]|uniref:BON domain-containing protein n=1 Tax=Streptomyces sp. NPDC057424 TaxID=3346127 RepID=UPI0036904803